MSSALIFLTPNYLKGILQQNYTSSVFSFLLTDLGVARHHVKTQATFQ